MSTSATNTEILHLRVTNILTATDEQGHKFLISASLLTDPYVQLHGNNEMINKMKEKLNQSKKISHNQTMELQNIRQEKMKVEASCFEGVGRQRGQQDD